LSLARAALWERPMAERAAPLRPQIEPRDRRPGGEATAACALLGAIGTAMSRCGAAARWASWAKRSAGHHARCLFRKSCASIF
jgi:hypothetical protein